MRNPVDDSPVFDSETLARIARGVAELERQADALNAVLNSAEDELRAAGARAPASVPLPSSSADYWQLGWGKHDREWMFLALIHNEEMPLSTAPFHVRVAALDKLRDLSVAIAARLEEMVTLVEKGPKRR